MQPWVIMLLRTCSTSLAWQRAAADVGDAQVAGIDEADELGRLVIEQCVGADRIGRTSARPRGSAAARGPFLGRRRRVAAVAIAAAELDRLLVVQVADALMALHAADALGRVPPRVGLLRQIDRPADLRRHRKRFDRREFARRMADAAVAPANESASSDGDVQCQS